MEASLVGSTIRTVVDYYRFTLDVHRNVVQPPRLLLACEEAHFIGPETQQKVKTDNDVRKTICSWVLD